MTSKDAKYHANMYVRVLSLRLENSQISDKY
ncbi:hypothetical protein LWI29_004631, partial [Acer saccharum]